MKKYTLYIFLLWFLGFLSSCSTTIEPKTNKDYLIGGWRIDEVSTVKKGTNTILKTWFKRGITKQSNWLGDASSSEEYKQFYIDIQDYEAYYRKDGKCSFMNTPFSIIAIPYSWLSETTLKTNQFGVFGNSYLEIENVKVDTKSLVFRMMDENVDNVSMVYAFDKVFNDYNDSAKIDMIFTFKRIL
jgi:hypothetical protein